MNKEQQTEAAKIYKEAEEKRLLADKAKNEAMMAANERIQIRQFRAMFVPFAIDALKAKGEPITMDGIKAWTEEILAYVKSE